MEQQEGEKVVFYKATANQVGAVGLGNTTLWWPALVPGHSPGFVKLLGPVKRDSAAASEAVSLMDWDTIPFDAEFIDMLWEQCRDDKRTLVALYTGLEAGLEIWSPTSSDGINPADSWEVVWDKLEDRGWTDYEDPASGATLYAPPLMTNGKCTANNASLTLSELKRHACQAHGWGGDRVHSTPPSGRTKWKTNHIYPRLLASNTTKLHSAGKGRSRTKRGECRNCHRKTVWICKPCRVLSLRTRRDKLDAWFCDRQECVRTDHACFGKDRPCSGYLL